MAIESLTITTAPSTEGGSNGIRLISGYGTVTPRVCWSTMWASALSFDFKTRWRGVPKGGTGDGVDGYGPWSGWKSTSLQLSQCNQHSVPTDDLVHWYVPLSDIFDSDAVNGGLWNYERRLYDELNIEVQCTAVTPGGWQESQTGTASFYIGAYPDYDVTDVYMQGDFLVINYGADGWTRKDDRYEILEMTVGGSDVIRPGAWGSEAGWVERTGWITVPKSDLQRFVDVGDQVRLRIRWNAAYRPIGYEWTDWSGTLAVTDHGTANTPTGDVTINPDGSVSVDVGDSGHGGGVINSWQVTIEGGGLEFDNIGTDNPSVNAMLSFPPLDTQVTIQIQGSTATGGTSETVEKTVFVPSGGVALIDPIDSAGNRAGEQVKARFNVETDYDYSRDKEVVKFAGRSLPSVAFGPGGEGSVSISWLHKRTGAWVDADPIASLRDAGLVVVRIPGGERHLVAIDSAKTAKAYSHPGYVECSLSGQEVV